MTESVFSNILFFYSKNCKINNHNNCYGSWIGFGFGFKCNCICHQKLSSKRSDGFGERHITSVSMDTKPELDHILTNDEEMISS